MVSLTGQDWPGLLLEANNSNIATVMAASLYAEASFQVLAVMFLTVDVIQETRGQRSSYQGGQRQIDIGLTELCRFLTNLPPHMQHLNYTLVQTLVPVGLQSVEEIEAIVHQATRPSVWPNWPPQQQQQHQQTQS